MFVRLGRLGALALAVTLMPATAEAATFEEMKAACYLGTEPPSAGPPTGSGFHESGVTPQRYPGVVTVSPREAKCAMDRFPELLVIAPMRDLDQIPNAVPVPGLALNRVDPATDEKLIPALETLTGGDKGRPILVYCHHASCGYSPNAALHLQRYGYRNILWMREGMSGWHAANYPTVPIERVRAPLGEPAYSMWIGPAGDTTFACFGEKKVDACNLKVYALTQIINDPELPPEQTNLVAGQLFNAAAVRAEVIREGGDLEGGYEAALGAYNALLQFADNGAKVGVLSEHAKVVRELAIDSLLVDRPDQMKELLAQVRADAGTRFAQLDSVRSNETELESVLNAMVSMEHLERDVGEFAANRALELLEESRDAEAARFRTVADESFDRAVMWIDRNAQLGIGHQMDLDPYYRFSEVMQQKGDLAHAAGDEDGARQAYEVGGSLVCQLVDEDERFPVYAEACERIQTSYFLLSPEFREWSAEQARREYEFYMSLLKD